MKSLQYFERLVLGCMDSYDSNQMLILQHFSRSTRLSKWISDFCNCSLPLHRFLFQKVYFILVKLQGSKMSFFRPNLNGFLSEFRKMIKNSKILMRVTRKVPYFLEIIMYEIFRKFQRILIDYFIFR